MTKTLIGIDIGGSKTAVVEATFDASIITRKKILTQACRPFNETFPHLAGLVDHTIAASRREGRCVSAISVSVGGPLQIARGVLEDPPHLSGWHGVALRAELEKRFPGFPVRVEHDGNAGALAEHRFGIGLKYPGIQHLIFLTLGTGLGAGLIINGQLLRGVSDTAGEVGHMRLSEKGPVEYGKSGSWEAYCSGAGMLQLAREMFPSQWEPEATIGDLVQAMLDDRREALVVAHEAGIWLGRGIALLIDALNPEVIVLGSLAVLLGDRLLASARDTVRVESLPKAFAACGILPAVLGKQLGNVASLMAVLNDVALVSEMGRVET